MSPSGDSAVWVQRLNGRPPWKGAGSPGRPICMSSSPSGACRVMVWLPSSVQYRLWSAARKMPCAWLKNFSPHVPSTLPSAVEDDHGVVAAVEHEDPVGAVHGHSGHVGQVPARGQRAPAGGQLVGVRAGAQPDRSGRLRVHGPPFGCRRLNTVRNRRIRPAGGRSADDRAPLSGRRDPRRRHRPGAGRRGAGRAGRGRRRVRLRPRPHGGRRRRSRRISGTACR